MTEDKTVSHSTEIPEPLVVIYIQQKAVLVPKLVADEIQRLKDACAAMGAQLRRS
jgi:hypothetical protein